MARLFPTGFHRVAAAAILVFCAVTAAAQTTNAPSDAEMQGRALAQKILARQPANNFTNTGRLEIRSGSAPQRELSVICETVVTGGGWRNRYVATTGANHTEAVTLTVVHADAEPNQYTLSGNQPTASAGPGGTDLSGNRTMIPFAGSDFWLCDLGLEFFHWPQQQVLKKEFHRQCACTVLESTNPSPAAGSYSRVVCWIDNDSLGVVEAYAYDVNGQKLKNFYPKNFEKINGQYQVQSMVMENLQTDSRSVMEFDLSP